MKEITSRRETLCQIGKGLCTFMVVTTFGPSFLGACDKSASSTNDRNGEDAKENHSFNECPNQENLSEQENNIRKTFHYVDNTKIRLQTCDNCKLYTLPINNTPCGGCKIVPGPIHPKGYCTAWVRRM